jgi:hypothetical protein
MNRTGFVPAAASTKNGNRGLSIANTSGTLNKTGLRAVPMAETTEMTEIGLRARSPTTVPIRGWILTKVRVHYLNGLTAMFR